MTSTPPFSYRSRDPNRVKYWRISVPPSSRRSRNAGCPSCRSGEVPYRSIAWPSQGPRWGRILGGAGILPGLHLESGGEMAKGRDAVPAVQRDRDHVEAAGDLAQALPLEIVLGQLPQPALLALPDGRLGRVPVALPEGLDLDEDEGLAVARHEIDLAEAGADVPGETGETARPPLRPVSRPSAGGPSRYCFTTTRSNVISVCPGLG